jgi:hypothetical protein
MKYLKKFNESYGLSIEDWCNKFYIEEFTIIDDIVNVNTSVYINRFYVDISIIPVQFGYVNGSFSCDNNTLTSLKGCPYRVLEGFYCHNNKLTSLIGGPKIVNGDYYLCENNLLITLDGMPKEIPDTFQLYSNPIYEIYRLFKSHKDYIKSLDYEYLIGTNIVTHQFKEACLEAEIQMPDSIPGYKYI